MVKTYCYLQTKSNCDEIENDKFNNFRSWWNMRTYQLLLNLLTYLCIFTCGPVCKKKDKDKKLLGSYH